MTSADALAAAIGAEVHSLTTSIDHRLAHPVGLDDDCAVLGRVIVDRIGTAGSPDAQTQELLDALDRRNVQSAGDLERYDRESLDLHRLRAGVHAWFCTASTRAHALDHPKRPHIGWACERGATGIARVYAKEPAR